MRPRSTPRVLPAQTDLGFAPLSTTSRSARTKGRPPEGPDRDPGRNDRRAIIAGWQRDGAGARHCRALGENAALEAAHLAPASRRRRL